MKREPNASPYEHFRRAALRSEEHTSELQSRLHLVCRLLLEKKKQRYDANVAIFALPDQVRSTYVLPRTPAPRVLRNIVATSSVLTDTFHCSAATPMSVVHTP